MVTCSHCGTFMLPMADGRCPSCWSFLHAPVTEDDLARIAARRLDDEQRRSRPTDLVHRVGTRPAVWLVAGTAVVMTLLTLGTHFGLGTLWFALNDPNGMFSRADPPWDAQAALVNIVWCAGLSVGSVWLADRAEDDGVAVLLACGVLLGEGLPILACGWMFFGQMLGRS
jgi:hypothetical protein